MSGLARTEISSSAGHGASALDRLVPAPTMREMESVIVPGDPNHVWQIIRHLDLASSRVARLLFMLRTLPNRMLGQQVAPRITLDDLVSSPAHPGFQILVDEPPRDIAVGAIGKVWHLAIPFIHVADANAFARFDEEDFIKVAWAIRIEPHGSHESRVAFELRVAGTDAGAWQKFERYFRLIGPGSHFIRRTVLTSIARAARHTRALNGDDGTASCVVD